MAAFALVAGPPHRPRRCLQRPTPCSPVGGNFGSSLVPRRCRGHRVHRREHNWRSIRQRSVSTGSSRRVLVPPGGRPGVPGVAIAALIATVLAASRLAYRPSLSRPLLRSSRCCHYLSPVTPRVPWEHANAVNSLGDSPRRGVRLGRGARRGAVLLRTRTKGATAGSSPRYSALAGWAFGAVAFLRRCERFAPSHRPAGLVTTYGWLITVKRLELWCSSALLVRSKRRKNRPGAAARAHEPTARSSVRVFSGNRVHGDRHRRIRGRYLAATAAVLTHRPYSWRGHARRADRSTRTRIRRRFNGFSPHGMGLGVGVDRPRRDRDRLVSPGRPETTGSAAIGWPIGRTISWVLGHARCSSGR